MNIFSDPAAASLSTPSLFTALGHPLTYYLAINVSDGYNESP